MPELSDLSIDRTECTKCGAVWLNKQHMWATGGIGKGQEGGDTWEKRALLIGIRDNNEVISGVFN